MEPDFRILQEKKLVGMRRSMSLAQDQTPELFRLFMPRRKEIKNPANADIIAMLVYDPALDFKHFTPHTNFEKWAAVEVKNFEAVPEGMETFTLPGGLHAVFLRKGNADTVQYIFSQWLPGSNYIPDKRPHFAVMGERYKGNDPDSEEEIWIPVKPKS